MSAAVPEPSVCSFCGYGPFAVDHWIWVADERLLAGGSYKCRQRKRHNGRKYMKNLRSDPGRSEHHREVSRKYLEGRGRWMRYKSYRHIDNKRYGGGTLTWPDADSLMAKGCFYCGLAPSEGLDRRDNDLGHSIENVVPCCVTCNHILGDVSAEVKDLLAAGLREARARSLLDTWTPPQFRKSTKTSSGGRLVS